MNTSQWPRQRGQIQVVLIAIACASLLLSIVGLLTYQLGRSRGLREAVASAQAREKTIAEVHQQALDAANQRERAIEDSARRRVSAIETQFRKERDHEKANRYSFAAAVHTGAVRLSIPTIRGASCGTDPGADPALAGGDRDETRAQLAPKTGLDLVAIADDGNDAIHQLNACIDTYNTVRSHFNNLLPQEAAHAQAP
ncbi:lysis system i-spanin subunit Rz [Verminephrobacter aporrectodeae]|uniref:lysis system i-spanin subunit Rz n=1 Tax=Verminephrobacter aporrectodeae TaxID=1110389 RepID=UPI0022378F6D|nr:lysis system i-spanin subunit Rz [Verminephrobacter aporrectodeae]